MLRTYRRTHLSIRWCETIPFHVGRSIKHVRGTYVSYAHVDFTLLWFFLQGLCQHFSMLAFIPLAGPIEWVTSNYFSCLETYLFLAYFHVSFCVLG